jgi:hypothetical protein
MTDHQLQSKTSNNAQHETTRDVNVTALLPNDDKSADASLEERMLLLDVLNNEGMSYLDKASKAIDLMFHPLHSSSPSVIKGDLEKAYNAFEMICEQWLQITGVTLAEPFYNLACVQSLRAELILSSKPETLMFGGERLQEGQYIDARLEEAEQLLTVAIAAGLKDTEQMIKKDRKLRALRAASSIHDSTQSSADNSVVNYHI